MSAPKRPSQARSKILRLAFPDRMAFNRLVRDGYKGPYLRKWLAEHGVPGVNAQNISAYRKSAHYRDWLKDEAQIQRDRAATEDMMRLVDAMGGSSASSTLKAVVAGKLLKILPALHDTDELKEIVSAFSAITRAEKVELDREKVAQRDEALDLARAQFEVRTCELFLRWREDDRAREIADSTASNSEKIEALRREFFKDVDALERSGRVELPS